MAGSQDNGDHPYEPMFEEFFDLEAACAEDPVRQESVCGAEPQAPDHPSLPDRRATFESRQEQDYPTDTGAKSSSERLLDSTWTGIEPPYEHEQLPHTNHRIVEVQSELEGIELKLRRNELQREHRALLRQSSLLQQGKTSERSGLQPVQDNIIANDSIGSMAARSESFNHTTQSGIAFVSPVFRMAWLHLLIKVLITAHAAHTNG